MPNCLRLAAAALIVLGLAPAAPAKPAHKQALADYFGPFLAQKLNNCQTCHLPDPPSAAVEVSDKPHNAFGARLKEVRQILRKAGKQTDLEARLQFIFDEDSDGDGIANFVELLTGSGPGDPRSKPSAAELEELAQKRSAFKEYKSGYPWRPFEVVRRPPVPPVRRTDWVRQPIDAFVATEHEKRGLTPRPEADKAILLRRVYLDLIGLPPTPAELHAFLEDTAPDAYEKVVDHLLASPQYGERWGRHWMDVWRYSDWAGWGKQVRDSLPHIWHWRDWIVESLNRDQGYDRMILEMLAADELAPEDTNALRATGYLVRNYKLLSREKWLQDTVDHTAQAFLGVTLGCARCHDHMYDPIAQQEYYQVRAIFEPHNVRTDRVPGQMDTEKDGLPRAFDADLQAKTFLFIRGDDRTPAKEALAPGVPQALGGKSLHVEPVPLPPSASLPDKRPFVTAGLVKASAAAVRDARKVSQEATGRSIGALTAALNASPLSVPLWALTGRALESDQAAQEKLALARSKNESLHAILEVERLEENGQRGHEAWQQAARRAVAWQRQVALCEALTRRTSAEQAQRARKQPKPDKAVVDARRELARAIAAALQPLHTGYARRAIAHYPEQSTGRRLAFARWIADRDNPLTARVAVNHLWLRHFGQALVPSVFDFGRNGRPPSHPALLDWLAAEFMDQRWAMKPLHRMLVTSSTYRMASTPDAGNEAADRDNRYLWRMPPRRVEAEVVRDCVFFVARRLDTALGGPDLDYHDGLTRPRRSLYFRHAQEKQMEFLKLFDCAAVTECYQRKDSVLPQQALALANSELTIRNARLLARVLAAEAGSDPALFTRLAFDQVLSRPPTGEETAACVEFLHQQEASFRKAPAAGGAADETGRQPSPRPELRARENLVHVLLNHHDFVTIR